MILKFFSNQMIPWFCEVQNAAYGIIILFLSTM